MPVHHVCSYLPDWSDIPRRPEDFKVRDLVRCLKGDDIHSAVSMTIGGAVVHGVPGQNAELLRRLWSAIGSSISDTVSTPTAIIPIPDSMGRVGAPTYRTLSYAQSIAAGSRGSLLAFERAPLAQRQGIWLPDKGCP